MGATLEFLGAAGTVTGSSYLVSSELGSFFVDCGLHQGEPDNHERNFEPFTFDPAKVDFLLLTHAHLDHCGLIPKLYRHGFRGKIYSTPATYDLAQCVLSDAAHIQEHGATDRQLEVLYDSKDAEGSYKLFETHPYGETFSPREGIRVNFVNAGHILGSASIEVWVGERKLAFSGDLGNSPAPLMSAPTPITSADVVVCESTYGDRNHTGQGSREEVLLEAITRGLQGGGKIIIPCFAIDRTQDLLFVLNNLKNAGKLPASLPVILDSPLAIKVTQVYQKYAAEFNPDFQALLRGDPQPFAFPGFRQCNTKDDSKAINALQGPAVIMAGSGMADAGRVQFHLLHHLSDPHSTVVFVGFQAPGTLGQALTRGERVVHFLDETVHVNAQIVEIGAFSGHADQSALLGWLGHYTTRPTVYLSHGEDPAREVLAGLVEQQLHLGVHLPHSGDKFAV